MFKKIVGTRGSQSCMPINLVDKNIVILINMAHNKNSDAISFTRFCAKMGCPQDGIPKESSLET